MRIGESVFICVPRLPKYYENTTKHASAVSTNGHSTPFSFFICLNCEVKTNCTELSNI